MRASIERVPADMREGARNLVHYVALRQHDLRDLQVELAQLGLSSLGRSESCVRGSLIQVSRRAHEALALHGEAGARRELERLDGEMSDPFAWQTAKRYLHQHTRDVLGPRPDDRHIYIMVTAPGGSEADRAWMVRMLRAGMNVLRINCAHDGPEAWRGMVEALGEARDETGKECRVLMDLAGPKIRTGSDRGRAADRDVEAHEGRDRQGDRARPRRRPPRKRTRRRGGRRPCVAARRRGFRDRAAGRPLALP